MVVLHGMLGSSRNWLSAGGELAKHGWHVHAVDLRNHGRSPHAEPMHYEAMAEDVLGWLDAEGLAAVDVIGHSMGGKLGMLLAARHPERVKRLVVVDIAPKDYLSRGHRAEFAAMHELRLSEVRSRGDAEMKLETRVPDWGLRKFLTTNLERDESGQGWRWVINLPVISASLPSLERNPLAEAEHYDGPTLFIAGGKSRYIAAGDLAAIHQHFPAAEVEFVPDSGHNPHMEARAELVDLIVRHAAV